MIVLVSQGHLLCALPQIIATSPNRHLI